MKNTTRCMRKILAVAASAMLLSAGAPAFAQTASGYPNKPIRIIVAFAAGGVSDLLARVVGERLSKELGQPVIVDNRVGAGGMIGTRDCINAPPDGYTLCVGSSSNIILGPLVVKAATYDGARDLQPITAVANFPGVLAMNPQLGVRKPDEFLRWAKAHPGSGYGTGGPGTLFHIMGLAINQAHGTTLEHIPYRGGSAATVDAVGGSLPIVIDTITSMLAQIEKGALVPIVTTGSQRAPQLRNVPTAAESLLPNFQFDSWQGIFAPAGVPPEIVARLGAAARKLGGNAEVTEKLLALGGMSVFDTPEQFGEKIRRDIVILQRLTGSLGLKPQ